ncbi:hypothetical protein FRC04_007891 [Tulasnella sp. 424]|nr:hypothetical protein FRC04_007891 [Tulasnella sp. 424]KAG8975075.1 hypothetical protein FRC05_006498 [Tulasnella sp. 425]
MSVIKTPITELFKIQHPILLAGMNVAAGPELAAAVTNAGGLGVIGGVGYTPKMLRSQIKAIKADLKDPNAPFGVDLLLPQVGGSARKTNYDYTKGQLPDLIDVIIEEKASLFVCAVGVPPKEAVDKLHSAGIPVMNMVGHPKHVAKALEVGVDLICAQGSEGGGHTGDIPTSLLIPACVDAVKGKKSPLTGGPVHVIAAGGIFDGRGLAAALVNGAVGVWVGTRFVASEEANAPKAHKQAVVTASLDDDIRTLIYTGRPLRVRKTPYIMDWEENRQAEMKQYLAQGVLPIDRDMEKHPEKSLEARPWLLGKVSGLIDEVLPAKKIIDDMVSEAASRLNAANGFIVGGAKARL